MLVQKLDYVQNWTQEESSSISNWFSAYVQNKYVGEVKSVINNSHLKVHEWLAGQTEVLQCEFPFSMFDETEFNDIKKYIPPEIVKKFTELLDIWPTNEEDFAAYASCIDSYLIYNLANNGIFKDKAVNWFRKNEKRLEELFFKTEDPRLKKLYSEALPPHVFLL